jgi:hypothetical protein|tara:strand:+ start:117 stop:500 length:384 start_codon:yes stop_codon:yes gene_type:complete
MSNKWIYATIEYSSEDEVGPAVVAQKARLENNPTDWVIVKELTGNADDGWVVPSETLSDSEINSLDATKHYSVASIFDGDNDLGLTASETTAKIAEHRILYARRIEVNTVLCYYIYPPSNVDMSGYV